MVVRGGGCRGGGGRVGETDAGEGCCCCCGGGGAAPAAVRLRRADSVVGRRGVEFEGLNRGSWWTAFCWGSGLLGLRLLLGGRIA